MSCETCVRLREYGDAAARSTGAESYAFKCPACGSWIARGEGWKVPEALRTAARLKERQRAATVTKRRVLVAVPGRLGPARPADEVWWCALECGCVDWRARTGSGGRAPARAPRKLLCDRHRTGLVVTVEQREAIRLVTERRRENEPGDAGLLVNILEPEP